MNNYLRDCSIMLTGTTPRDDDDEEGDEIDWDNQEMDYELIPRKITTKKTIEALPIKNPTGL